MLTGVPYIWTSHIDEIANPKLFKKILKVLKFPIIAVSSDLKQMLVSEYNVAEKRISVVLNGFNVEKFYPLSANEKNALKQQFSCGDKYVFSLLARITFGKGHMYLLEAVNKLKEKGNIKVLIAGKCHENEKEYLNSLIEYAKNNNIDMEYVGFRNPREIFGISDISVLPSLYEGFGLTVLESLAMECPVVRSDTPGVSDTKDIAFVFKKKDVDALKNHLEYAINNKDEMREKGKNGKETVLKKFTIQAQVDNTIDVYKKYMKNK